MAECLRPGRERSRFRSQSIELRSVALSDSGEVLAVSASLASFIAERPEIVARVRHKRVGTTTQSSNAPQCSLNPVVIEPWYLAPRRPSRTTEAQGITSNDSQSRHLEYQDEQRPSHATSRPSSFGVILGDSSNRWRQKYERIPITSAGPVLIQVLNEFQLRVWFVWMF